MRKLLVALPALWLATATAGWSQTSRADPVDFHTRTGTALRFDMPRRWEGALEYELRMVENSSTYRGSYLTGELGRGVTDFLTLFGSYRLALVDAEAFHRFAAGAQAERDFGGVELAFRPMVQYQRAHSADEDQSTDQDLLVRTRFRVRSALARRVDAYASTEPYFTLAAGENPIDNLRNTLGFEVEYARRKVIDVYYIYRPDFAKNYNRTFHTLGVNLEFEMDLFKRRN